jgi:hypothetical protein
MSRLAVQAQPVEERNNGRVLAAEPGSARQGGRHAPRPARARRKERPMARAHSWES